MPSSLCNRYRMWELSLPSLQVLQLQKSPIYICIKSQSLGQVNLRQLKQESGSRNNKVMLITQKKLWLEGLAQRPVRLTPK